MDRGRPLLLAVAAVVAALVGAVPAPAATPSSFFGVMADGPLLGPRADLARESRLMRGAGVHSVRAAFYWRDLQPAADGPVDFAATDRIVEAAAGAGLTVFPVLVRAPRWAAAVAGEQRGDGIVPEPGLYGRFTGEVVRRYGPGGSFWAERPALPARPIRSWQVWNEPDIEHYLDPIGTTTWQDAYVPMLKAAHAAIKAADPGAEVVAAGLTNRSWVDLRKLYAAGARRYFDVAAIHPFSRRVGNVVLLVERARREMARAGDARKPIVLSELSWSCGKGRSRLNYGWETTERGQAERVEQALTALARARTRLRIDRVYWYTWLSPAPGSRKSFDYAGLRRLAATGTVAKPAYGAFTRTVRRLRAR